MSERKRTRDSRNLPDHHADMPPSSGPATEDDPFPQADVAGEEEIMGEADEDPASALPPSSFPAMHSDDEMGLDMEEEGDGEDLINDRMGRDYRSDAILDEYEADGIDDDPDLHVGMDAMTRREADARMDHRDAALRHLRGDGHIPGAFADVDEDALADGVDPFAARHRRRLPKGLARPGFPASGPFGADPSAEEQARAFPIEALRDVKAPSIAEWALMAGPREAIASEFKNFLQSYLIDGASVYGDRVQHLGQDNASSLTVDYPHLIDSKPVLAKFLLEAPAHILPIFDSCAYDVVLRIWPHYASIHPSIRVRIAHLPVPLPLRDLRKGHLNRLIRVRGVVTRRTGVFPQLSTVTFECPRCGNHLGPFVQEEHAEIKVGSCPQCENRGAFRVLSEKSIYNNYQRLTLQESPGTVPAGRLPRHREVILMGDLVDSAKPGEEIDVTGIYRNNFDAALNARQGFPVFATVIEANCVEGDGAIGKGGPLSSDEERLIRDLAKDDRIFDRIVRSIAPSIYGHEDIKVALALAMFGGVPKDVDGKHRLRGDINVLLLGDPGTAKSQFLKYVEKTAHRAVFTTGQGASAVGLTASVRKDPITREWTLEGGALVLADKGVCLIDEFDKMNDADRTSIHEAMEQQSISVSKAGIVTSLQARCSVIAAANPIRGRYNPSVPFGMNVELTEPILSRFDVLCVVRDTVDPVGDELLGKFVIDSHTRSHPDGPLDPSAAQADEEAAVASRLFGAGQDGKVRGDGHIPIDGEPLESGLGVDALPQDLLRKYIQYARSKVFPRFSSTEQQDKVATLYADLRRESLTGGSIPITVRHVESMIRMAEARARMHLREHVIGEDLDLAIRIMLESFIGAQKHSVMRALKRSFARYVQGAADHEELLLYLLHRMVQDQVRFHRIGVHGASRHHLPAMVRIPLASLSAQAPTIPSRHVESFLQSVPFHANGFSLAENGSVIVRAFGAEE